MIRLSKLEEQIMDALWELGKAFPKVLLEYIEQPTPPYNTVLSTIRKLEQKGYVGYEKYGKSHEYFPILEKGEYTQSLFKKMFHDLMQGSPETMVSYFAKDDPKGLEKLEAIIEKMKKDGNTK